MFKDVFGIAVIVSMILLIVRYVVYINSQRIEFKRLEIELCKYIKLTDNQEA